MTNNRVETRLRSHGHFRVFAEGTQPIDAKLLDISPSGFGLEAAVGLEPGTVVRLDCHGILVAEGVVRHCRVCGDRFLIGVALSPLDAPHEPAG